MDPQLILGFAVVSVSLALTPGADWAYAISSGLGGRKIAPAVGGLLGGYLIHTILIVAGLAALVIAMPQLLAGLTIAGAAYLLWLGISTTRSWRSAGYTTSDDADHPQPDNAGSFLRGLGTSGTNPKALLLYLALIPQFIDLNSGFPAPVQTGILGISHLLVSAVVYTGVAFGARRLLASRPSAARIVTLCSGIIMLLLGAMLLAEQIASFNAG
ncbi:LysE family translocator [Arthrobacter rhombi]|uniref:LysE family translocator n=1 Tax=Arthrobacter rhombi TaxID=71253 RepID=UPI0031E36E1B